MSIAINNDIPPVIYVNTLEELIARPYHGDCNAICLSRVLNGNFSEVASKIELTEDITNVSIDELKALNLTPEGDVARNTLLGDLKILTEFGAQPSLNLIKKYERDEDLDFIATDVYSYHVDHSPIPTDTYLCTYFGASSDILPNNQAIQKIQVPEIRQQLLELYDGLEAGFEQFLSENFLDLHYLAKPEAQPISLGIGNLWKLAVDHPEQKVLPCVHRAPVEKEGEYRLLLIC